MRILFAGTPEFAAEHLHFLLDNYLPNHNANNIIGVYTQPDRPAGRGRKLAGSPVKLLASAYKIPVFQPENLRDEASQQELINLNADLLIVVAYGLILPKIILDAPQYGCINIHASLLPRWRGAAPIQRAIEAGDTETGITIMQMDEGLDTGDMLLKVSCSIKNDDTASLLHDRLITIGCSAISTVLQQLETRKLTPEKQNHTQSCYAAKITKAEAKIDWTLPANIIERKIRAFNPFPIAFFELDGNTIRVWEATIINENTSATPGTILSLSKEGIAVATQTKILLLKQLQLPGKKPLHANEILNGHADWFPIGKIIH
jgi:methionyl-tRNA formyltransferase